MLEDPRTDREQVEPSENDAGRGEDREGELGRCKPAAASERVDRERQDTSSDTRGTGRRDGAFCVVRKHPVRSGNSGSERRGADNGCQTSQSERPSAQGRRARLDNSSHAPPDKQDAVREKVLLREWKWEVGSEMIAYRDKLAAEWNLNSFFCNHLFLANDGFKRHQRS